MGTRFGLAELLGHRFSGFRCNHVLAAPNTDGGESEAHIEDLQDVRQITATVPFELRAYDGISITLQKGICVSRFGAGPSLFD